HSNGDALMIAYNAQGRVSRVTDPGGRAVDYAYDATGEHLVSVTRPGGVAQYTYLTGQGLAREHALASITYADGTHAFFDYDDRGRLVHTELDGGAQARTYSYDPSGGVTVTDAAGGVTTYLLNEEAQVAQVIDPLGRITGFSYDVAGLPTRVDLSGEAA